VSLLVYLAIIARNVIASSWMLLSDKIFSRQGTLTQPKVFTNVLNLEYVLKQEFNSKY